MSIPFATRPSAVSEPAESYEVLTEEDSTDTRLSLLLAFLLPMVVLLAILAGKEIYPFGHNSFLRTDMYHQYAPFFAEFRRLLTEGKNLSYTFEIGLGTNFQALYAYYLASPLNWFVFLCPSGLIIEFMTCMIVLKTGFCGFAMALYLKHHFRTDSLAITFFGICYALCGYMAAYSWNIMWMDSLWLAPLILLGAERLIREARPFLYVITLGLAILCNYYIAIMLCIFLVLYFLCEVFLLPELTLPKFLNRGILFALYSLLAGGVAAVLLIPAAMALMNTASADSTFPSSLTSYFTVVEMLARHMVNVDVEIGLEHWPNIYSGVICLFLMPIYVISPKIPARKKIVQVLLLAVMLLSFSLNIPNYIWHGLHFPNSLPCRQSFLYTIVLLTMCYEALRSLPYISTKQLAGCLWGDIAFVLLLQQTVDVPEIEWYCFYLTLGILALYVLLIWLWKRQTLSAMTAVGLSILLVCAETGMNMAVTSITTTDRDEYWRNTENYQTLVATAAEMEGGSFFRTEKASRRTKNDGAWTGYHSASIFSSATEAALSDFYKTFGMEGNTNAYSFTGATPLMESLLSVGYRISSAEMTTSELLEFVKWEDTAYLYHNPYTLPLGFMIPSDLDDYFTFYEGDPVTAQNSLVSLTTGSGPVLTEVWGENDFDSFTYEVTEEGRYFAVIGNHKVEEVSVSHGGSSHSVDNVDRGFLVDLGIGYQGETLSITTEEDRELNVSLYRFDSEAFIRWYEKMATQVMTDVSVTNDRSEFTVTGSVDVASDSTLFLSVPYEDGWTVLVDGVEAYTDAFADAFLSVELPAGAHDIVMTYHTPGQSVGLALTLLSILLILITFCLFMIFRGIREKLEDRRRRGEAAAPRRPVSPRTKAPERAGLREEDFAEEFSPAEKPAPDRKPVLPEEILPEKEKVLPEEILLEDEEFLEEPEPGEEFPE